MARDIRPDAMKGMDFDNPQPVGDYTFVQDRITKVGKNNSCILIIESMNLNLL